MIIQNGSITIEIHVPSVAIVPDDLREQDISQKLQVQSYMHQFQFKKCPAQETAHFLSSKYRI